MSHIAAYRTCEFVTIAKDGTPVAWPTSGLLRADGSFLLTTSIAYPQKAFNIRRDDRVALLFSDPTGSGLDRPEQILVRGTATCPDEIHTDPRGDLAAFWARLFELQPKCRSYLDWPATTLTDFYFMRLLISVTPAETTTRPLPGQANEIGDARLIGADVLRRYRTVVLAGRDPGGAPVLVRTTVTATDAGYRVQVPADVKVAEGPASLLVHRHDERLWNLHNAGVFGELTRDGDSWTLVPGRLVEPGARSRPGPADTLRTLRACRATTRRYLERRSWPRPAIPWQSYRAIRAALR